MSALTELTAGTPAAPSSPSAARHRPPSWRDPRLVIGLAIVAVSVLLGGKILGGADDSISVWTVTRDLPAGSPIRADDLASTNVRLQNAADLERYLPVRDGRPAAGTLLRSVGEGELLPRAAVGGDESGPIIEVPVAAETDAVPATVSVGSVVDVWVTPEASADQAPGRSGGSSIRVFDDVVVVSAPRPGGSLSPATTRQVIIGLQADQEEALPGALARAATGRIVITKAG